MSSVLNYSICLVLFGLSTILSSNAGDFVSKDLNYTPLIANKMYNISVQMSKQAKLPCFVEFNRKYVWLDANKDQIISIDSNIIANDRRFSIELSNDCFWLLQTIDKTDGNKPSFNGCWIYLIINYVLLNDESLYICQTDTMYSTSVYLTVLVSPYLIRSVYLNHKHAIKNLYQNSLNVIEGNGVELICEAAGKPKPITKWFSKDSSNSSTFLRSKKIIHLIFISKKIFINETELI
jgi:hypothetical protein